MRTNGRRARHALLALLAALAATTTLASTARTTRHPGSRVGMPSRAGPPGTCTNRSKLADWSTKRLALLTIAVPVAETSPWQVKREVEEGAGGVVLFESSAPAMLGAHLAKLQSESLGHLGILVMTDEEGGGIQRMANLVGSLPWPAWMGRHWSPARIQHSVSAVAEKMAAAQVNMDLAPVVDVDGTDAPRCSPINSDSGGS